MFIFKKHFLHLFDDGGSGTSTGEGAGDTSGETTSGADEFASDENYARLPDRAKATYRKAVEKVKAKSVPADPNVVAQNSNVQTASANSEGEGESYADLIKSEKYKAQHQEYMDKTIGERFKKYKGIEDDNARMRENLEIMASKYGVDPSSETFLDDMSKAIADDTSFYEDYAIEHDIPVEEARKLFQAENQLKKVNAEKKQQEQAEQSRQQWKQIEDQAKVTQSKFKNFDLESELQNETFRSILAVTGGNTTMGYYALHGDEIFKDSIASATQKASQQTVNAIASNSRRPIENGVSSQASAVFSPSIKGMNAKQIREYAKEQLRMRG